MRYLGLRFKKIFAEKIKNEFSGNIDVKSNFNLGEIKEEKEFLKNSKNPVFSFAFTYTINYEEIAKIEFSGVVYVEIEDKSLVKELEKNKRVSDNELRKFILDVVLARTHVESLHLEEKLNLPFHIQSPRVSFGEN